MKSDISPCMTKRGAHCHCDHDNFSTGEDMDASCVGQLWHEIQNNYRAHAWHGHTHASKTESPTAHYLKCTCVYIDMYDGFSSKGRIPLVFRIGSGHNAKSYKRPNCQRHSGVSVEAYINIMEPHLIQAGTMLHG
jgi:hypothetical protein